MSAETDSAAEKSHEPTARRLERAREQGDLPNAQDAQTFAAYLGFGGATVLLGGWAAARLGEALLPFLDRPQELAALFFGGGDDAILGLLGRIAPPLAVLVAAPAVLILVSLLTQRAIVVAPQRVRPKLSRISPVQNARQKYGPRGLVEFAKSAVKLAAVCAVLALVLREEAARLARYAGLDARLIGSLLAHEFRLVIVPLLAVTGVIAASDLVWQRLDHLKRLRMSHRELKEESRQTEGDPHMRAERRDRARRIANNRMLLAVPEADVVIVNPAHYAVALKWRRGAGAAPVCVAKGVDEIALAIRSRAEAAGVPVRADPPTARSIHALVEVGQEIRAEHYQAVAAAIIFADEMRRKARERRGLSPAGPAWPG